MRKALFVSSVFGFFGSFERNDIQILQKQGFEIVCAANGSKALGAFGDVGQFDDFPIIKVQIDFARSPFSKSNFTAYRQLKKIIKDNAFEIIHCHTPVGGILTRLAARKARKKGTKVIYTAHGFHFYKGAPLIHWLVYYPIEKIFSYLTDVLITINQEDYALAKKTMRAKRIVHIPGVGVDTRQFANVTVDRMQKRNELGIPNDAVMLLSVGELNHNKNHEVILHALAKLNDPTLYYCIAGQGDLENYLKERTSLLGIQKIVQLLGFRDDVGELYKAADIFCFPSHREGLGLAALEAMAVGLPLITSNVHGIKDYSQNGLSGYACHPTSADEFARAISILSKDSKLREKMGKHNASFVKKFDRKIVEQQMRVIYGDCFEKAETLPPILVSVIVPIYRVEAYLSRCIESILHQTYTHLEILLIDDGSPDDCGRIIDEYAQKDTRIHVIHQTNGGLSAARNTGIEQSTGDYITFVDSDDFLHPHYIKTLLHLCLTNSCDVAQCGFEAGISETFSDRCRKPRVEVFDHIEVFKGRKLKIIACCKLYQRQLFSDVRFPVGKINEDEFTTYKLVYGASKIGITSEKLYYYYQTPHSIMREALPFIRLDFLDAYRERMLFFKDDPVLYALSEKELCIRIMLCIIRCKKDKKNENDQAALLNIYREHVWHVLPCSCVTVKEKVMLRLFRAWPEFFAWVITMCGLR